MLDPIVVIGIVIIVTELVKELAARRRVKPHLVKQVVVPVTVLAGSAILNALNAYLFGGPTVGQVPPGTVRQAVAEGVQYGAMASGIYGLGKAAMGRS